MQIEKDLSNLTTIPIASVEKILSKFQDCICYGIQEALKDKEEYIELDIFIGKLILKNEENRIFYKFIPSSSFEEDIIYTFKNGESPLVKKLETSINDKITAAYKELF